MTEQANTLTIPAGYLKDRKGRLVPEGQVDAYDLEMDEFVKEQCQAAQELHDAMKRFKKTTFGNCAAWMDLMAEKYGRQAGGQKGNVTFSTFDGEKQIRIQMADQLRFGPELHVAKDIIDECLKEWSANANQNLVAIIQDAFEVDREGKVNTGRILSLRKLKIDDERWTKAMQAIADSIIVSGTKAYVRFLVKGEDGGMTSIPLDLAAL